MIETSARLLRLLSLLQTPREWSGPQLAERLGVTTRTVRNDVERLRRLGYPVHATPGTTGGYRLGAGASLPPLLLDDDEAVAVAVGLRGAAGGSVTGIEESSVRALTKLEQVLPSRLRYRINALQSAMVPLHRGGSQVDADVLMAIAGAIRDRLRLRFDYGTHDGTTGVRDTEPHRLVHTGRRWYLAAWDVDRQDWRTFRVDRMAPRIPTGPRFVPRDPPEGDVAGYVSRGVGTAMWRYRARVTVHAPAEEITRRVPWLEVEPVDEYTCVVNAGSDSPTALLSWLTLLEADFTLPDLPELRDAVRHLTGRLQRSLDGSPDGGR